jgi:addiction module HigA family antidote
MKGMPMKKPAHPGALLKDDLEALGTSIANAAKALGITRQQLYRVTRGECAISPSMAVRLEKALGGAADFWLRMQMAYDLSLARQEKIGRVERLVTTRV